MRRGLGTAAVVLALASGCRRSAADLPEWTPRDHDSEALAEPGAAGSPGPADPADPNAGARALFVAQCSSCHGTAGHGDGPMAAMFHPADLGDAALQRSRTDDALALAIANGKGRMPAFGSTIRPEGVRALVRLIRSWAR